MEEFGEEDEVWLIWSEKESETLHLPAMLQVCLPTSASDKEMENQIYS